MMKARLIFAFVIIVIVLLAFLTVASGLVTDKDYYTVEKTSPVIVREEWL